MVLNLKLELGALAQEITLSAEGPVVNTTTAEVAGFVGQRAVKDLPLNGRSWDNLVALNPGRHQLQLEERGHNDQQREYIYGGRAAPARQSGVTQRH